MTTIAFPSRAQHNSGFFDGLRDTVVAFIEGVNLGLEMSHRYDRLSRMSEDELAKRGLRREDVTRAVVLGHAGI